MTTTDAAYQVALAELDRDYAAAFPTPLIHSFARAKWAQIQGGKWRSEKGRVLSNEAYQRHQQRLKAIPTKGPAAANRPIDKPHPKWNSGAASLASVLKDKAAGAAATPSTPSTPTPAPAAGPSIRSKTPGQPHYTWQQIAPGKLAPPLPPLHPVEAAHLDQKKDEDTARYGAEHAGFLHRAAHAVRDALSRGAGAVLGGAVGGLTAANGATLGALAGGALGGPLGMALGTAVGGGLGVRGGLWAAKKINQASGGDGRLTAQIRQGARAVLPKAAAVAGALPGAALAGTSVMGTIGNPVMALPGVVGGFVGGQLAAKGGAVAHNIASDALHPSLASQRKRNQDPWTAASRSEDREAARPHSEDQPKLVLRFRRFTDLSSPNRPNPGALITARLKIGAARAGITLPPIPPELVQQCMSQCQQGGTSKGYADSTPPKWTGETAPPQPRGLATKTSRGGLLAQLFSGSTDANVVTTSSLPQPEMVGMTSADSGVTIFTPGKKVSVGKPMKRGMPRGLNAPTFGGMKAAAVEGPKAPARPKAPTPKSVAAPKAAKPKRVTQPKSMKRGMPRGLNAPTFGGMKAAAVAGPKTFPVKKFDDQPGSTFPVQTVPDRNPLRSGGPSAIPDMA